MKYANDNSEKNLEPRDAQHCSFCGKTLEEIDKLIISPTIGICDECVLLCLNMYLTEPTWPAKIPYIPDLKRLLALGNVSLPRSEAEKLLSGSFRLPNKDTVNGAEILTAVIRILKSHIS